MLPQHCPYNCAIDLQEDTQPLFLPIFNLSHDELVAFQEYLDENLVKNFIQHPKSLATASIIFVKKRNGLFWMCVDYCGLNKIMIKKWYPLPLIFRLLDQFGEAKVYTKIDL
jgi:hypothetical protein